MVIKNVVSTLLQVSILLYFVFYVAVAGVIQFISETPPWIDGSPIEYFTGGLLWMSSLTCLFMSVFTKTSGRRSWLWLAASAGLALLAIDEIFALHERTSRFVGDDDHIKLLQWLITGVVLYILDRFERSTSKTRIAFITGFVLHSLYIFCDIGDGDYFRIPYLPSDQLHWAEEFLEMFTLAGYEIGLILLFLNTLKAKSKSDPGSLTG